MDNLWDVGASFREQRVIEILVGRGVDALGKENSAVLLEVRIHNMFERRGFPRACRPNHQDTTSSSLYRGHLKFKVSVWDV